MTFDPSCDYCVDMACSQVGIEEPHEAHAEPETFVCDICGDEIFVEAGIEHAGFEMCPQCYTSWDDYILLSDELDKSVCKGHYCNCNKCAARRASVAGVYNYTAGG